MLFYYRNMLLIYQNMLLFLKNTKICNYMPKISKKEQIYPISDYNSETCYSLNVLDLIDHNENSGF